VIVDSSALIAIISDEDDGPELAAALQAASGAILLSAANYLEAGIVIDDVRYSGQAHRLDALIFELDIEIAPVTPAQAKIARQAYRDFGRGSGHPAKLNFGDCFAYALAIDRNEPLLFKGDDFTQTGVRTA
jgi:ribonuclease VapC